MTETVAAELLARVSTPGKLILVGEHGAVYGLTALTAAVGLRLRVDLCRAPVEGVDLDLAAVGHRVSMSWSEVVAYASDTRRRWERYAADSSARNFARLDDPHPARLAIVALGEAVRALDVDPTHAASPLRALRVRIESDLPVGAGFGSSAAAAVAVVMACHAACGRDSTWSTLDPVVLDVERRQHGTPSGVDGATAYHGGVLQARKSEAGSAIEPLAAHPPTLRALRVFQTGRPPESTGEVVAAVRARREEIQLDAVLRRMDAAVAGFRAALIDPEGTADRMIRPMRDFQRCLEAIGVVPEPVRALVRTVEAAGGAAKISGAGSLAGPGAGSLLVLLPEGCGDDPPALARVQEVYAPLAAEGARVEVRP